MVDAGSATRGAQNFPFAASAGFGGAHASAVVFSQSEYRQPLWHVLFEPAGQLWRGRLIGFHEISQSDFGGLQGRCVPDGPELGTDTLTDREIGRMVDGALGQMELAALPFYAAEYGLACGAQTGVVV